MKEEEIIRMLREDAEQNIPDVRERVRAAEAAMLESGEVRVRQRKSWLLWAASALLLVLLLAAVFGMTLWGGSSFKIVVSINPSVEFSLEDGKVVGTRSLNKDAAVLIKDEDFTGETAEEAVLRFAALAESKHLIGADGIRIRAEGRDGGAVRAIHASLSRTYAQYSVTDLDEASFHALLAGYNESEMGDFEDWLTREFDGQQAQFKEEIDALLKSYEEELEAVDTRDRAAVEAFNLKYLKLGEDVTFEDGDESKEELLSEFRRLKEKLGRDPASMTDELFREFIDELEDIYEDKFERDDDDDDDDDDDRDDHDDDDDDDDD